MSLTDEFWQYAKEAALAACYAESDDEKQGLLDLAQTWTQAALIERRKSGRYGQQRGSRCVRSSQQSKAPVNPVCLSWLRYLIASVRWPD